MFEKPSLPLAAHIAIGVAIGVFVGSFAMYQYWQWESRTALQASADKLKADIAASQAEQQRKTEAARKAEAERRLALAAAEHRFEQAKRDALQADSKRQEAWARFYRKSPQCDESRGGSWSVACANEFIRAKKAFAEQYKAGGY